MTDAQTEARAIAQTSLWIPAKPEHAKLGWSYDFEQTERIARAAYDSTGYDATMEVVEFVMAEADRRHRDALAAKDAELEELRSKCQALDDECQQSMLDIARERDRADRAEAQLAEARKELENLERKICAAEHGHTVNEVLANYREVRRRVQDTRIARRALEEQGGENG